MFVHNLAAQTSMLPQESITIPQVKGILDCDHVWNFNVNCCNELACAAKFVHKVTQLMNVLLKMS